MGCQKQCTICGVTFNSEENKVKPLPGEIRICGLPECRNKQKSKRQK
jgi:hypothetical protein